MVVLGVRQGGRRDRGKFSHEHPYCDVKLSVLDDKSYKGVNEYENKNDISSHMY